MTSLTRDAEAVRLLALHRFLTRPQLEELLFMASTLTPRSRQVVTWRLLGRLQRQGQVAATSRQTGGAVAGSTLPGYFLTTAGLRSAAALCADLPARRPARRATFLMPHSLMTTEVELAFRRAVPPHPGHALQLWECDWQIRMRLGSSSLVPDARFIYQFANGRLHAFVEVDLGTEGTRFFARKVARYVQLQRSGAWREFVPVWPRILTIAPTDTRAASLAAATAAALKRHLVWSPPQFAFCSIEALRSELGPFGVLWRVAGEKEPCPLLTSEQVGLGNG